MRLITSFETLLILCILHSALPGQKPAEDARLPIHPLWNQGQELLSEWRGQVLLVIDWDHTAPRSREIVSLAAHLSERYQAKGLSVVLHHRNVDKEAPAAALRAGATRGTLLAVGAAPSLRTTRESETIRIYGPDGSLASGMPLEDLNSDAIEKRIQELLRMRSEGFGPTKLARTVRRTLYAKGDFARAEQQIEQARDLSASAEELQALNVEVDAHFEGTLNQLRHLERAGRLSEALKVLESLRSRTWSDPKRRAELLREYPNAPYYQDHLALTASEALDRTWQIHRWRIPQAAHLINLRKSYQTLSANHPVAERITLLIDTLFPGRKI